MRFRIWYDDGTIYTGDDPALVWKRDGVQIICQKHPEATRGSYLSHQTPFYIWMEGGGWVAADQAGFWDYLLRPGVFARHILIGRTMPSTDKFNALLGRAEKERLG